MENPTDDLKSRLEFNRSTLPDERWVTRNLLGELVAALDSSPHRPLDLQAAVLAIVGAIQSLETKLDQGN